MAVTRSDSGVIGQPISYRGPDGHQYIAVLSGVGGWSGAVVSGPVDPRDGSAALGMVNAMSDLPKYTTPEGHYMSSRFPIESAALVAACSAGCSKANHAQSTLAAEQPGHRA